MTSSITTTDDGTREEADLDDSARLKRTRLYHPLATADWQRPCLVTVVDVEEEFDWSLPFSRDRFGIKALNSLHLAQRVFERMGVVPSYLVDYPVIASDSGTRLFRELAESGRCLVGAQLHPWVNPPFQEALGPRNSFPGNLPRQVEREKLLILTSEIEARIGLAPTVYKAGRYGLGPHTASLLEEFGYRVDTSVVPHTTFAYEQGPDFRGFESAPFWFGERERLLELPVTRSFAGFLAGSSRRSNYDRPNPLGRVLLGALARTGALERITLTPEGITLPEMRRLAQALLRSGNRLLTFSFHSSSLMPGSTQYVRNAGDLVGFLDRIAGFLDYFAHELGGEVATPLDVYARFAGGELPAAPAPRPAQRPAPTVVRTDAAGTPPLVSVVIPAYNSRQTILRALDSVSAQRYPALEVIVVDDASSDGTAELVAGLGREHLALIRLERNQGASGARNVGIAAAKGEFVAFLDADDEWLPEKLHSQMAEIRDHPEVCFVACAAFEIDTNGRVAGLVNGGRAPATRIDAWRSLLAYTSVTTPSVLARRSLLLQSGGFDPKLRVAEDQDLWIRLARLGEVVYLPEPLVLVHDTPGSLTKKNAHDELTHLLPMVLRHIDAYRGEMKEEEVRFVLRSRFGRIGRNAFGNGLYGPGLGLILGAVRRGDSLADNLWFLLANAPPSKALRRAVGL